MLTQTKFLVFACWAVAQAGLGRNGTRGARAWGVPSALRRVEILRSEERGVEIDDAIECVIGVFFDLWQAP